MGRLILILAMVAVSAAWSHADEADDAVAAAVAGSEVSVVAVAPDKLVPAIYRALDTMPPRSNGGRSVAMVRVERLLFDLESRTRKADLDKLFLAAWPVATRDHTKADLLYKFGERRIRDAEPIVVTTFNDKSAGKPVRDNAAAALVALDWAKYRPTLLPELNADDDFAPLAVELALFQRREVSPAVISIAARRIERRAAAGKFIEAGMLAQSLGHYTGEANGVTKIMRAELPHPNDVGQVAELELRSFRVWWSIKRERFEAAAKAEIEKLKAETPK